MPDEGESNQFKWPALLVVVAAAIGGLFWFQSPLRSSRPPSSQYHERRALGDQVVNARLWQDPFETVAAYQKAENARAESKEQPSPDKKEPQPRDRRSSSKRSANGTDVAIPGQPTLHTIESVVAQMCRRLTNNASTNRHVLVLLQMVSGGLYLEDSESRLRSRNAVISALGRAGYAPWDEEHIDYFTTPWPRGALLGGAWTNLVPALTNLGSASLPLTIPFEWFQPSELCLASQGRALPTNHVLVCWLPREAFADHPLKRLAQLLDPLWKAPARTNAGAGLQFQLFDPGLHEALVELGESNASPCAVKGTDNVAPAAVLTNLEIYSSWSTSPDALLAANATEVRRENIRSIFSSNHMAFTNVTATDDQLADKLIEELNLRGIDLQRGKASVALISEWDTYYGRALPLAFSAKLVQRQRMTPATGVTNLASIFDELRTDAVLWPTNVLRFSYLRGVDGKLPGGEAGEKTAGEKTPPAKSRTQELQDFERPEGCSQLDYMPRLAGELRERELEADREGKPPIRAIGVLGSDVYDKLLLIQALRDRFPGTLFFTVDLDARLFHPTELDWSRNLLVASSFDLELEQDLQDPIPPFRDTYQTGKFLACLFALGQVTNDLKRIEARVFEVGHHGAYVLGVSGNGGGTNPFYSTRPPPLTWETVLLSGAAVLLAFVLVLIFSSRLREWVAGRSEAAPARSRWIALGAVVLLAALLGLIRFDHAQADGEPFSLFEGVSIWSAEVIRLTAVFLGLGLFVCDLKKLETDGADLKEDFLLSPGASHDPAQLSPGALRRFCREMPWIPPKLAPTMIWLPERPKNAKTKETVPVDPQNLWRHYERWGLRRHRRLRIAPAMVTFFGVAILLMQVFGFPRSPYRGTVSMWTDVAILAAGVLTLVFLTFFVVDAVRACRRFIEALCAGPIVWPPDLLKRHAEKRHMEQAHLHEWLALDLVARRTRTVGKLIYLPFIVLALMIVSRNTYFDRWDWPLSLVVVIGIISIHAWASTISLRQAAEKVRRKELGRLKEKLLIAIRGPDKRHAEQIQETIKEIESLREGAFAPITQQPFFHAIFLVLGGAGSLPLTEFVPRLLGSIQ